MTEDARKAWQAKYREKHREKLREYQRRYRAEHPEAMKAAQKRSFEKHREAQKARQARYRAEHPELVINAKRKSQRRHWGAPSRPEPKGCEICARPEGRTTKDGLQHGLSLDHDHQTGAFRGWLCRQCNLAIGNMMDNPALLRSAADYLEGKHR